MCVDACAPVIALIILFCKNFSLCKYEQKVDLPIANDMVWYKFLQLTITRDNIICQMLLGPAVNQTRKPRTLIQLRLIIPVVIWIMRITVASQSSVRKKISVAILKL